MQIEKLDRDHFLIKELIDSYRDERKKGSGQRDKQAPKNLYMSFVSRCDRDVYYRFVHPEKIRTLADKTIVFFRHGNMYHDEIQERLKKKRVIDNSRDIEYGLEDWAIDTTGRLDCFVSENSGLVVTELKSKNPYAFNVEEPHQEEIDQLFWYIYAAKKSKSLKERNIQDYGYILYMERGEISDFPFAAWKIPYDEKRVKAIRKRFRNLKQLIDTKKIPQRPYERDSIKCNYCRFREFCWKGVPEVIEPELLPDVSIEKPEMELVQSAENRYILLKEKMAKEKEELEKLQELLLNYFKATGAKDTEKLLHVFSKKTYLDEDYLLKHAKDKWPLIAKSQVSLIKKAIKDKELDPEIFERAKKTNFSHSIRIKKGGKNANQKPK